MDLCLLCPRLLARHPLVTHRDVGERVARHGTAMDILICVYIYLLRRNSLTDCRQDRVSPIRAMHPCNSPPPSKVRS